MRYTIGDDHCVFAMSNKNTSVMQVPDGAEVVFKTKDCFANQIQSANVKFDALDWDNINPATGPIHVEGAEKGDVLKVQIKDIQIGDQCTMVTGKDLGVAGSRLQENYIKVLKVSNGHVEFSNQIKIPIRPMVGVIGVAPENESINCGTPGFHGGNMDCKEITANTTLYFPVNVEGAQLAMGDLHAVMGDGEVSVCGAEIPGEVTVQVSVIKNKPLPTPILVTESAVMTIASAVTLDEAVEMAVLNAVDLLKSKTNLSEADAISLLSLAGNVAICQVVDPLKTVRMEMPISILKQCDFQFDF